MTFPKIGERQWVTIALFALAFFIIGLMACDEGLRKDDLFKVLAQAIVLTAVVNGIVAFHFSSNKGNEKATENTATALTAITAVAAANAGQTPTPDADEAQTKADEIKDKTP